MPDTQEALCRDCRVLVSERDYLLRVYSSRGSPQAGRRAKPAVSMAKPAELAETVPAYKSLVRTARDASIPGLDRGPRILPAKKPLRTPSSAIVMAQEPDWPTELQSEREKGSSSNGAGDRSGETYFSFRMLFSNMVETIVCLC